ncbi:hypothetical protein AB1Y20_001132 [Prymnesium parvum]|uniref:Formate nitrite transporter n=1 Tax=Prymnesium parvum TaxID=97485 RepID=A0AB34KA63_PRYPA
MACRQLLLLLAATHAASALRPGSATPKPSVMRLRGGSAVTPTKLPADTYQALVEKGTSNAQAPLLKALHQSFMGGMFVAIGGVFSLVVAGALPGIGPDLQRFVIGLIFPIGLIFILMAAGQLMTGNFAICTAAWYEGRITTLELLRAFAVAGLGNTLGCTTMSLLVKEAGLLKGGMADLIKATAVKKCSSALLPTFIKAVLCNWLVSLAIFLATASADMPGKILGIWSCIPMFVCIGLEHSVANIFFLPLGKLAGAELSFFKILTSNILIVTLGNLIGGGGILAGGMSFQFGALGK